jgi:two-component system, NarL family, response regulator NreC
MTAAIRVVICDDHTLLRSGLRRLLEGMAGVEVVGEAANADEAIAAVARTRPDVLLLDIVMPGRSGIEAIPDLQQASAETRVLVLSMQDDATYVRKAFEAGAHGYLLKEAADGELLQAIIEVANRHHYVHPALGARIAARESSETLRETDALSEREHDVLRLLALGHTNQEIARLLFISIRTVETHRARIMQKLGLATRAEIVRYALRAGELTLEEASA